MQPYFHRGSTTLSAYFQRTLVCTLLYFIRGRFINFSTRRNKSLHTQGHLSFTGKNGPLYCPSFKYFSVSMFISLPFGTSLFLLGLLSAVLIAVAFRQLATKSSFYFACFYFYFAVFLSRGYCSLAAIVFAA